MVGSLQGLPCRWLGPAARAGARIWATVRASIGIRDPRGGLDEGWSGAKYSVSAPTPLMIRVSSHWALEFKVALLCWCWDLGKPWLTVWYKS